MFYPKFWILLKINWPLLLFACVWVSYMECFSAKCTVKVSTIQRCSKRVRQNYNIRQLWQPNCRTDVRRHQTWGNSSDATLLTSPEPAETIPLADVLAGLWNLWFARWPLLASKCAFQKILPRHFLMNYLDDLFRHYRFHSFRSPDLYCTFYRVFSSRLIFIVNLDVVPFLQKRV